VCRQVRPSEQAFIAMKALQNDQGVGGDKEPSDRMVCTCKGAHAEVFYM